MPPISKIIEIFDGFRMPPLANDQYEELGKPALADKISPFVAANRPINFVMLGYPMKSPNDRDKVIGRLPDMAEQVSFDNFRHFDTLIRDVYPAGVNISIVSDGYIFSDILEVPDKIVAEYEERNRDISRTAPIDWYDMKDFFPKEMTMDAMRDACLRHFGITTEELEKRILLDPDVNSLYRGMIRFIEQDLTIRSFPSLSQLHKKAKIVGREMMFRNEAYSSLIRTHFTDHIRLSMHPSVNNGAKYSFQLIPSPKARHSPWHAALLINADGTLETIHRKDAEERGFELVYKDNQPYYFQA